MGEKTVLVESSEAESNSSERLQASRPTAPSLVRQFHGHRAGLEGRSGLLYITTAYIYLT